MNNIKTRADAFMWENGMLASQIDSKEACRRFAEEMDQGLLSEPKGSLKMLCTYIGAEGQVNAEESVIAIDAGGTNLRIALVTFKENVPPRISQFYTYRMPGTNGEMDRETFLRTLADYLLPVIDYSNRIGFCFSFPTEILPDCDGRVICFNKEVNVKGMDGHCLDAELLETLERVYNKKGKRILILNDTVATLLAGKATVAGKEYDGYIGFILGTGTNTCFVEDNEKLRARYPAVTGQGKTIVNIESGGYAGAPRGIFDRMLDAETANPGDQMFEKMISGAYQGELMRLILQYAAQAGLFSRNAAEKFKALKNLTGKDLNEFCDMPESKTGILAECLVDGDESDRDMLYCLVEDFYERTAKLVAINLVSITERAGIGHNPEKPVCIAAEGTTFYKSNLFQAKLESCLQEFIRSGTGPYYEFVKGENVTLVGSAMAALLNK